MSIQLVNLHEHEIIFSYITHADKDSKYKYEMHGWYRIKKNESIEQKVGNYINLHCKSCGYKYRSNKNIKTYTTNDKHTLFFEEFGTKKLYTIENIKIEFDSDNYYKADYYLINTDYKDIFYVGEEKEIRDYFFSEMKKNEKYKNLYEKENKNFKEKKSELQKENDELKEKNTSLQNIITNYNNEQNKEGEYDIVLCADSIKNLTSDGWKIKYNKIGGKEAYEDLKKKETIVVGVVGNGNKGKSFLLKKLSNYQVPMGYNVKTEGLSIIYGKTDKQNLAILDSAGQETPLLIQNRNDNNNANNIKINNKEELEFEEYSRDKLVTELYIQQFILWKSNIIILLVGSITLSEQKLYARIKSEVLAIQENQKESKKLFIVHNLQNFYYKDDVNDYIENVLKKLYNVELKEIQMYDADNQLTGFDRYFLEKSNKNIIHLLFINDYCEYSSYYNKNTIWYLTQAISQETSRQTFEILENSKKFLLEISEQIMENKLLENDIKIIVDEETNTEKLIIENHEEIQLKKFIVDEMGITKNDGNTAKYSYYIDTEKSKFVVNFELPGGGSFEEPTIKLIPGYYSFRFEGEQNGELSPKYKDSEQEEKEEQKYEELSKEKLNKIMFSKNLRKKHPIQIDFKVSSLVMQIKYDSDNSPEYTTEITKNGIIIFIFDIILLNKSSEKKDKKKFQF